MRQRGLGLALLQLTSNTATFLQLGELMSYIKICLKLTYVANQQQKHSRKRRARIISRMMRAMAAARGTTSNPPHHRYTIYNSNQYRYIINTGMPSTKLRPGEPRRIHPTTGIPSTMQTNTGTSSIQVRHLQQQSIQVRHQYRYAIYNSNRYRYVINTGMPSSMQTNTSLTKIPPQCMEASRHAKSVLTLRRQTDSLTA